MHLTPGVVHNFLKAMGVKDFGLLCTKRSQIPIRKEKGAILGILVLRLNNRWYVMLRCLLVIKGCRSLLMTVDN